MGAEGFKSVWMCAYGPIGKGGSKNKGERVTNGQQGDVFVEHTHDAFKQEGVNDEHGARRGAFGGIWGY